MIGRVVEIAEDGRHLSLSRGFMVVKSGSEEAARVPLDDIAVVIANAHGLTYSNNLLLALAERNTVVILCGPNHLPRAWVWPLEGHHVQAGRMRAQLAAPKPLGKRLWQAIVKTKIAHQAAVLRALGKPAGGLEMLARKVRSGDPTNVEAQASRRYWPLVMGKDFRRDRHQGGANALLNYGYTVLRSGVARAVVSTGLHPSVGIHHYHPGDAMCLVDDLMEPFRPLVDLTVARLVRTGSREVTSETKKALAATMFADMRTQTGTTMLATCLERLAVSLAQSFESGKAELDLPLAPLPLELPIAQGA